MPVTTSLVRPQETQFGNIRIDFGSRRTKLQQQQKIPRRLLPPHPITGEPADPHEPPAVDPHQGEQSPIRTQSATPAVPKPPVPLAKPPAPGQRFLDAFGRQGGIWFSQGRTFEQATALAAAETKREADRLARQQAEEARPARMHALNLSANNLGRIAAGCVHGGPSAQPTAQDEAARLGRLREHNLRIGQLGTIAGLQKRIPIS